MKKIFFIAAILLVLFFTACVASTPIIENPEPASGMEEISPKAGDSLKETPSEQPQEVLDRQPSFEQQMPVPKPETEPEPEPKLTFRYPDAVRGIYVTGHSAGAARMAELLKLVDDTELNTMVIDVKDDFGNVSFKIDGTPLEKYGKGYIKDPKAMLAALVQHHIYPVARIVIFKDSVFAAEHPEYSFLQNGQVWKNSKKEAFVNPFLPEVWEHNIQIAKEAAALGFPEIQFDYVRFPEGFEKKENTLAYSLGDYTEEKLTPRLEEEWQALPDDLRPENPPVYDPVQARVTAVTDFVKYASEQLKPLGVKVSVDIFGYSATVPEAPGIGQNFVKISENVDVISSMIYPSHWTPGYFGIAKPDKEPYQLVRQYVLAEKEKFAQLSNPPASRPWIQDFTASWLGDGYYLKYGKAEVEAQIKALNEGGIHEFLIWNPYNTYTENVDYTPELAPDSE